MRIYNFFHKKEPPKLPYIKPPEKPKDTSIRIQSYNIKKVKINNKKPWTI